MQRIAALFAGLIFGAGLTLSGMVNPMKVVNFLDLFGAWDPTLIFVMGAGLMVTFIGYRLVLHRTTPLYAGAFSLPATKSIDARLIGGSVLFGAGWGLTGFCPGPAIASLVFGLWPSVLFVAAMAVGMLAAQPMTRRSGEGTPRTTDG